MKRGISPLVATVLIISLVVVVAVILVYSLQDIVDEETGQIESDTDARSYCLSGIDLSIETPCEYNPNPLNSNLSIKLKNYENGDISGFIFKVTEAGNTYVYENNLGMPGLGSKRYFLGFAGNYNDIQEIVVVPKVSIAAGEAACNEIVLSMDKVNRCCLDLDGDHVDSCNSSEPLDTDGVNADCNESDIHSWKLWEDVYPDFDNDGATSMFTQVDHCGNETLYSLFGPRFTLTPGTDCIDYRPIDCVEWYNNHIIHSVPPQSMGECLSFNSFYINSGYNLTYSPAPNEDCFDYVDNNCDGRIDGEELGPACIPTCFEGNMALASYPCKCSVFGTERIFYSDPGSNCDYCCGGNCQPLDCDVVPIET